jgi:nitroreductase
MLTVEDAIKQRRTIRRFRPDPVPKEMILQMLDAARLAPSGSNRQPWRYAVVSDADEKKRLRALCLDQAFLEEAGVLFVTCADPAAYSSRSVAERNRELSEAGVLEELSGKFADPEFRQQLAQTVADPTLTMLNAVANTCIATEHLVLMATALGLGSCWIGLLNYQEAAKSAIRDLLGIPASFMLIAVVAVGYSYRNPPARPRLSLEQILVRPLTQLG